MEDLQDDTRPVERLIRIAEVKRLTGLSTATLYRKISTREFPRPVQLGAAARAWPLSEIQDWISARIELRGASMTNTITIPICCAPKGENSEITKPIPVKEADVTDEPAGDSHLARDGTVEKVPMGSDEADADLDSRIATLMPQ